MPLILYIYGEEILYKPKFHGDHKMKIIQALGRVSTK
jgi:hypothetical protein